jgi:hypothetical protein
VRVGWNWFNAHDGGDTGEFFGEGTALSSNENRAIERSAEAIC